MHFLDADRLPMIPAGRVRLREMEDRDVGSLFTIYSNAEVARYTSRPPITEVGQARALLDEVNAGHRQHQLAEWGVALNDDDRVIGTCILFGFDGRRHRAELGYSLARDQWGHGYMQEALTVFLDFAFGDARLHRIEADADPRNVPSLRTLERLGFTREGLLRERWLVGEEIQDTVMFGLLAREWRARRQP